jgi:hypothetical protein
MVYDVYLAAIEVKLIQFALPIQLDEFVVDSCRVIVQKGMRDFRINEPFLLAQYD